MFKRKQVKINCFTPFLNLVMDTKMTLTRTMTEVDMIKLREELDCSLNLQLDQFQKISLVRE